MNFHLKKIYHQQNIVLAHFYDFCGDRETRPDLDIFLKLLLSKAEDEFLGDFPIHGIFLVFDVNLKRTLEDLNGWLLWFYKSCLALGNSQGTSSETLIEGIQDKLKNIPVFLIGNKIDKITSEASLTMKDISLRQAKQENIDKVVLHIMNYLRKKFALLDFENLLMTGKKSTDRSFKHIDELIISVFERDTGMIGSSGIELGSYTLERCIHLKGGIQKHF